MKRLADSGVSEQVLLRDANRDIGWLNEHYSEVVSKFNNNFVAVKNKQVVAADHSLPTLAEKLHKLRLDPRTTLIKYVTSAAVILQGY